MARYTFDCETDGLLPKLTKLHCLVLKDVDTGKVFSCKNPDAPGDTLPTIIDGLKKLMEADEIIGHNIIKFDSPAITKVYPWFKLKPTTKVTDTLVCARLIWPDIQDKDYLMVRKGRLPARRAGSHALEAWGYRLGVLKGEYGGGWDEWSPVMQQYCEQDVEVTAALYKLIVSKNYSQQALELEHRFAEIIWKQEQHGFRFNVKKAEKLYADLVGRRLELVGQLKKIIRPWWTSQGLLTPKKDNKKRGYTAGVPFTKVSLTEFNPSSRDHIADRLTRLYGWKPSEFTDGGKPKVDETVLLKLAYEPAKLLCAHFLVEKRIGQLAEGRQAWLKLEKNGRIHGSVNTNGAVTGRCTHANPNVSQTPAVKKGRKDGKVVILYGEEGGWGYECRDLFDVDTRKKLVGADASGLELRCLAHYMARYDDGAYGKVLLEGDIHTANQQAAGLPTRDNAKTFIYAFLYGAGDEKIGSIVLQTGSEEEKKRIGKRLKKSFLDKTPALKRLREEVAAAAMARGHLRGLDGRLLNIRSPHAALNTLLQSAGSLIVKQATVFLYDELSTRGYVFGKDFANVAHIHDELQIETREEIADEVGKAAVASIRKAGDHFKFRCPLDGEYKIGASWAQTH